MLGEVVVVVVVDVLGTVVVVVVVLVVVPVKQVEASTQLETNDVITAEAKEPVQSVLVHG